MRQVLAPLAIDLFCGLGGWTEGLLLEGYDVIGFDIERHEYGEVRYPAQLVLQDVLTLDGSQFKGADLIVASPPCQAYSYRAMPWKRARELPPPDNSLFEACFRIQREACEASGRHIPLIVENVRGAQKWVGRSRWNYGSFHLWGDVPALMPMSRGVAKVQGLDWNDRTRKGQAFNTTAEARLREGLKAGWHSQANGAPMRRDDSIKNSSGGSWFGVSHNKVTGNNARDAMAAEGIKGFVRSEGPLGKNVLGRKHSSKSSARKAASAHIAKIPLPLSRYIGRTFWPLEVAA